MSRWTRITAVALAVFAVVAAGLALNSPRPVVVGALAPAESARAPLTESRVALEALTDVHARKVGAEFDAAPVAVHGKCTSLSGAIVGGRGVVVRLLGPTRQVVSVPVRADGTFTAPELESGSWRVECTASGFHHAPFSVDARNRVSEIDVVLEPVRVFDVTWRDEKGGRLVDAFEPQLRGQCLTALSVRTRGDAWCLYERPALLPAGVDGHLSVLEQTPREFDVRFEGVMIPNRARVIEERVLELTLDAASIQQLLSDER